MVSLNLAETKKLTCVFGCAGPVGVFHVPAGCVVWPDKIQALCQQHLVTIESVGPVTCVVDLTVQRPVKFRRQRLPK